MIKTASFAILFALSLSAAAQTSSPSAATADPAARKAGQPDIPGAFVLELGINKGIDAPDRFSTGLWGSRTLNVYYQYDIRIMKSKFSLVPGIGLSLERFKLKNGAIPRFEADDSLKLLLPAETAITGLRRSQLVTNYIDIPVELRFNSNPEDPARGFKLAVGGRIGYLYDAFSKIKYKEDGEIKFLKDKQSWNLTQFRYGLSGRIGIGNFSLFGYYNLTPLFEKGKGPGEKNVVKDFKTLTVGISLSSF